MRKFMKFVFVCQILLCFILAGMLLADKQALSERMIRLHVVGNSDSSLDQSIKLQVRDAIIAHLYDPLSDMQSADEAKDYIVSCICDLEDAANEALSAAGSAQKATVTFCKEAFSVRHYDTFSLPSGVYQSLRVTIGEGAGKNWWCVVFPEFCMQATVEDMRAKAVSTGFSTSLTHSLTDPDYQISFFLLDCIGKLENLFYFR